MKVLKSKSRTFVNPITGTACVDHRDERNGDWVFLEPDHMQGTKIAWKCKCSHCEREIVARWQSPDRMPLCKCANRRERVVVLPHRRTVELAMARAEETASRLLRELAKGPLTSLQLGPRFGSEHVNAMLMLTTRGYVRETQIHAAEHLHDRNMWRFQITPRGIEKVREEQQNDDRV